MDQAILFCRTKLDCDNLERYLCSRGGGELLLYGTKWAITFYYLLNDQALVLNNAHSSVCQITVSNSSARTFVYF